jgi:leader peptidase (prepilin peptidase)/N-methyltransferase
MATIFLLSVLFFLLGAIIGSFLSVCVYRIPMGKYEPAREDIKELDHPVSIVSPARSFCPNCEQQIPWYNNIPIVSWIALRGHCASCESPIPFRYLLIELLTAALSVCCYLRFGFGLTAFVALIVVSALIVITFIDLDYMIIPDVITYPGIALGLILGASSSFFKGSGILPLHLPFAQSFADSFAGVALGAGLLYLVWWLYLVIRQREGLGLGDIKLLAMLGAIFGYECALATIFIGSVLGSIFGLFLILIGKHKYSMHLSFGPYLVVAVLLFIFNFLNLINYLRGISNVTIWRAF